METTVTQHQMLGVMDLNSLIPTPVSVNGGKLNSTKCTGLTELESSTEEIAAEEDLLELRSLLMTNFVVKFKMEPGTVNGTQLSAQLVC
jgi:hypothetical protein